MDLNIPPPQWPYTCEHWTANDDDNDVTIWHLYQADNQWPDYVWPHIIYNRWSPCYPAENWILDLGWHGNRFYWGPGPDPVGPPPPIEFWLLDHKDYVAQTVLCSSYGLMQVLYTTAVETQHWRQGQGGAARHPAGLLDPGTSLDLGAGYDATVSKEYRLFESSFDTLGLYRAALTLALSYYNSHNPYHVNDYGRPIVSQAGAFKPY